MQFKLQGIRYLVALFLVIGVLPLRAQDNADVAQQYVELADEIMRETKAYEDARDLYVTASNLYPNNVRADYMSGITIL